MIWTKPQLQIEIRNELESAKFWFNSAKNEPTNVGVALCFENGFHSLRIAEGCLLELNRRKVVKS